jgi:dihydrofolate reductase
MRKVILQAHMSLDGFADSAVGFVPINDQGYWKEADRALDTTPSKDVDTLLLGRGTFLQFASFWPKAAVDPSLPAGMRKQGQYLTNIPKVVFSRRLKSTKWANSTIVRGELGREIAKLKRAPGKNLLVPGGVAFPRALIERDLIDEYLISIVPVVVGGSRDRLFGHMTRQRNLEHVRTWTFRNGVTLHHLRPIRKKRSG